MARLIATPASARIPPTAPPTLGFDVALAVFYFALSFVGEELGDVVADAKRCSGHPLASASPRGSQRAGQSFRITSICLARPESNTARRLIQSPTCVLPSRFAGGLLLSLFFPQS